MENRLWYKKPAYAWIDALPVGNGRLAAMVHGFSGEERITLNHEWLWRRKNASRETTDRSSYLEEVRKLLLAGKYEEGAVLANEAFGGNGGVSGIATRVDPYQPAGSFYFELDHGPAANYRRELNIDRALVTVAYEADGMKIKREVLAHMKYDLIMVRISSDRPIGGIFRLDRTEDPECRLSVVAETQRIRMDGIFTEGFGFCVEAAVSAKGANISALEGGRLRVSGAREIIVFIDIGTSAKNKFARYELTDLPLPSGLPGWDVILKQHVEEHKRLCGRLLLEIPHTTQDIPTDERLASFNGFNDPGLPLLYFNYGRYLLCASSSKGELPANLQGKWNKDLTPPWECDYHHDINLQMNYWPAEPGNLQECAQALFAHMERMLAPAGKAARDLYSCRGVCIPIMTDAWGGATPEAYGWSVWIGAVAWLAQHMWWHYEYGLDMEFLKEHCYPFLKETAAFYEDYLTEDENGILQIVPSQSPENRFEGGGDLPVSIGVSSAMDIELASELLSHAIKASELLETDAEKRKLWTSMLGRLPKLKIGSAGQLLEWNGEFSEAEPGHRHLSHLFGLFPGESITCENTPDLYRAAEISLEKRLSSGGAHTGWSCAWTACMFARCGKAGKAWEYLSALIKDFASESLLDLIERHHPDVFQIDGNFGGTTAILEMLLQSYNEVLDFLPALPEVWPEGKISGVRARGGYTVGMEWKNGRLAKAEVISITSRECTFRKRYESYRICDGSGDSVRCRGDHGKISFDIRAGESYAIYTEL